MGRRAKRLGLAVVPEGFFHLLRAGTPLVGADADVAGDLLGQRRVDLGGQGRVTGGSGFLGGGFHGIPFGGFRLFFFGFPGLFGFVGLLGFFGLAVIFRFIVLAPLSACPDAPGDRARHLPGQRAGYTGDGAGRTNPADRAANIASESAAHLPQVAAQGLRIGHSVLPGLRQPRRAVPGRAVLLRQHDRYQGPRRGVEPRKPLRVEVLRVAELVPEDILVVVVHRHRVGVRVVVVPALDGGHRVLEGQQRGPVRLCEGGRARIGPRAF